jgi:ABC-type phosphate/phosphonate transport system ATPase subunit
VIGRKGTGKTAIFRWLVEREPSRSIVVLAPVKINKEWHFSAAGFKAADQMLADKGLEWREF